MKILIFWIFIVFFSTEVPIFAMLEVLRGDDIFLVVSGIDVLFNQNRSLFTRCVERKISF